MEEVKAELEGSGFACYETAVGGSGFGLVVPASPADAGVPTAKRFLDAPTHGLKRWADGLDGWSFV